MNIYYNTQKDIATNLHDFFKKVTFLSKPQLNILPYVIFGMVHSESCITNNIVKSLKDDFLNVYPSSVNRRIRRFFNNKHFDNYSFYDHCITYITSNYKKKHKDKRVHIVMDHMYVRSSFTIFMISLRVGKQSIPLWFRCFNGKDNPLAYNIEMIMECISYVSNLFKNTGFELIFIGDRWFNSTKIMDHINSLNHYYIFRLKNNYKCLVYDSKEGHFIWKKIHQLPHYKHKSTIYENVLFTRKKVLTNIVIGSTKEDCDPWIVITNGDPKRALKDYSYRFGAIEFLFKGQKSNGFNLERSSTSNLKAFENMYTCVCFAYLWMTILGLEYSKNTNCYKNIKIDAVRNYKNGKKRILSLFKTGLSLFHRAFNSTNYVRLPFRFILYDY